MTTIETELAKALEQATKTLAEIVKSEIQAEPELVEIGETTIRVPRLEVDPGGQSVILTYPAERFLQDVELEHLQRVAAWGGGTVSFGSSDEDGGRILPRIVFKRSPAAA